MEYDPEATAAFLLTARAARTIVGPLPAPLVPPDLDEAAAAQHALVRRLGPLPPAGFKVGATARRMQDYLGLGEPAAGAMVEAGIHRSGAALAFPDFVRPGVECELAVRLGRDLPPSRYDASAVAGAVECVLPAIELVENRYTDFAAFGAPALVADQVFHAAAVLGQPVRPGADLRALAGTISIDGQERDRGTGADLLGDPLAVLAWLAGSAVAARFGGLRAGQVVLLGSVTPPVWLDGPAIVRVEFPPLPPVVLQLQ